MVNTLGEGELNVCMIEHEKKNLYFLFLLFHLIAFLMFFNLEIDVLNKLVRLTFAVIPLLQFYFEISLSPFCYVAF